MTTSPRADDGPRTVGDYTLLTLLGEGGMGVVHLARHEPTGERVALKILRPQIVGDEEGRARLAREVTSLERVRSRWVAEIIDADPWGPVPFVATRYVPGPSLHDLVRDEGRIRGRDLQWLALGLARGVAACHEVGLLHRDIKPSNVLMEGRTPVLIDFGLARVADDPKITHTGWLLGTPGYLPPEILHGEDATPASDVHSWAATLAYAATGRPPFGTGPSMAIMDRARRGQHDLDGMPERLQRVLAAALDPDPVRRPGLDALITWFEDPSLPLPLGEEHRPAELWTEPPTEQLSGPAPVPPSPTLVLPPEPVRERGPEPGPDPRGRVVSFPPPVAPVEPGAESDDDALPVGQWAPEPEPEPERVTAGARVRRFLLWSAGALAVGGSVMAYPWMALATVCALVWFLRSCSIAAARVDARRRERGAKWYDAPRMVLGAPLDLLRALPSTLLLGLWAGGIAVAAVLLCYAVVAPREVTLGVTGTVFAAMLWAGPGGDRLRSPLSGVVHPLARGVRGWALALVLVGALGAAAAYVAISSGSSWLPFGEPELLAVFPTL